MTEELVTIYEVFKNGEALPYLVIDNEGREHHYPYQGTALVKLDETPQRWRRFWTQYFF